MGYKFLEKWIKRVVLKVKEAKVERDLMKQRIKDLEDQVQIIKDLLRPSGE